jgi:hypothetical protein
VGKSQPRERGRKSHINHEFPPRSGRQAEIEAIVSVLESIIEGRSAYYISTPMTTGKGLAQPRLAGVDTIVPEPLPEHQGNSTYGNQAYVSELAHRLRRSLASPVINPTAITNLPGWTQPDYRVLSANIIERHAHTVIFVDDWQYSLGCSYEFLVARQTGAKVVTRNMEEISVAEGIRLIRGAVSELKRTGSDTSFLKAVTRELEHFA